VRKSLVALALVLQVLLGRGVGGPRAFAATSDGGVDATPSSTDPALASSDPTIAALALFALAEAEEARGQYGLAAQHYRSTVTTLPSFRYAAKATTRAALLEAHAEGNWEPYARLEEVRRDPSAASDPAAIDALSAAADTFPPGPTRSEARMLCGESYVTRLHRRADGKAALRKVIDDPHADPLLRREALNALVTALVDDGDLEAARAAVLSLGTAADAKLGTKVAERLRRRRAHLAAIADLSLFALLAAFAIARGTVRGQIAGVAAALKKTLPLGGAFAAYIGITGGWLASAYEAGNAEPFLVFSLALLPVVLAARAWGAAGSPSTPARIGRALLSATAVVSTAFLTLEAVNSQYLESFKI
jgi:hypothetical protein